MMNRPGSRFYLFDGFRVDVSERLLFQGDREVPLTPKVFDTLLMLLENSSHVLTKKELMQQVWPDSFVEENNLAQNISLLRKALGEQYIQTVPKRGYRFIAEVTATGGEETLLVRERTRARIVVERSDEDSLLPGARVIDVSPAPHKLEAGLQRSPETMYARSGDVNIAYQVIGDQCLKVEEGRFVAQQIPGAKFVEFPGDDHLPFVGDQDAILDEVEEFLTGFRHHIEPDTVLATVLVARMVGVKDRVDNLGPERWAEWLRRLHAHIAKELEWFRGREIDLMQNRLLAIFDGPARAVRCAAAITEYCSRLGVNTCTGLHTGECEIVDSQVAGAAARMCVCVANEAEPGEVLVSSTVKDLVAGSGISFEDRGTRVLQGCGEWRLFAVQRST